MQQTWTLDNMYQSFSDLSLKKDIELLETLIDNLTTFAKDNFDTLDEPLKKIETYIEMQIELSKLEILHRFADLTLATESENTSAQKLLDQINNTYSKLAMPNALFEEFIAKTTDPEQLISQSKILQDHEFFLTEIKENAKHLLSKEEEVLFAKLKLTGSTSWTNMYDQLTSTLMVDIIKDNKKTALPLSTVRALAEDPSRDTRQTAFTAELNSYPLIDKPIAASLNAIKGEAIETATIRNYSSVLDMTLKNSRMDKLTLEALLKTIEDYLPIFKKYYKHKSKLLNINGPLAFYDLYAPVGNTHQKYTIQEAIDITTKSFYEFSDHLGQYADLCFNNNWVDWSPKEGKRGGAFCMPIHSLKESRVLMNYTGTLGDVLTLAHELGHGYHGFCLKEESPLNSSYPMPIAETASTFCETLLTNKILKTATGDEKLAIIEANLQGQSAVIVDIYSRFLFEDALIKQREKGSLSVEELNELMKNSQIKAYGDSLDNNTLHPYMWLCKGHYYSVDVNYYNFPYAYGLLFSLGLYSRYLADGEQFTARYIDLLKATGKNSLVDIGKIAGVNTQDTKFWASSMDLIKEQIDTFLKM